MGYDFQTLKAVESGVPVTTLAAYFQKDPQALMAHPDVKGWSDLKTRTLFIASGSETSFWPWLKTMYGYTDAQKRPYAFSVAPFLVDKNSAVQGYVTSEPYAIEQGGVKPAILLLADAGYPPYATTLVAMQATLDKKGDALARFVKASAEGWISYFKDPAAGNALIKKDNPKMTDDQIAYGIAKMKEYGLVTGGDAGTLGVGAMTDARWKQTYDVMVATHLLDARTDYRKAYTLKYVGALPRP
ncbi:ABC transporter substrate-binding protein [Derxia lacustris]|uniref:ABC transporter substrate-binding protein n=1 Tax=Derxia lacustris TaxID=764842 RepID=UPI001F2FAB5F|nr:ABC transporter substrate-binding protein [Derxia lacustris]